MSEEYLGGLKALLREMQESGKISEEDLREAMIEIGLSDDTRTEDAVAKSIYLCTHHGGYGFHDDCFICRGKFGPNLTAWIALAEDRIQNGNLTGISGHIFVDYEYHRPVRENGCIKRDSNGGIIYQEFQREANSSPVKYCVSIAYSTNASIENVAAELVRAHTALQLGKSVPVQECGDCLQFVPVSRVEEHKGTCAPIGKVIVTEFINGEM